MSDMTRAEFLARFPNASEDTLRENFPDEPTEPGKKRKKRKSPNVSSEAPDALLEHCRQLRIPVPGRELVFHDERKWSLDLWWELRPSEYPSLDRVVKIAVEIEGGIWMQTSTGRSKGHAHPVRFLSDMEKYNAAVAAGFRLFRFTPQQVYNQVAGYWLLDYFNSLLSGGIQ
jgi:hypothetical protein